MTSTAGRLMRDLDHQSDEDVEVVLDGDSIDQLRPGQTGSARVRAHLPRRTALYPNYARLELGDSPFHLEHVRVSPTGVINPNAPIEIEGTLVHEGPDRRRHSRLH